MFLFSFITTTNKMSPALVFLLFFTTTSYQFVGAKDFQMKRITESFDSTGGPFYDPRSEKLYFTDFTNGMILRYHFFTHEIENISFPEAAVVVPRQDDINILIVGAKRKVFEIRWIIEKDNYDSVKELDDISVDSKGHHNPGNTTFLQGRADVNGYLWFGTTMGYPVNVESTKEDAALYKFFPNGKGNYFNNATWDEAFSNLRTSGEVAWNFENTRFYFMIPTAKKIVLLNYYPEVDDFYNIQDEDAVKNISGYPVGLAVDTNGHLWISTCGEGYYRGHNW